RFNISGTGRKACDLARFNISGTGRKACDLARFNISGTGRKACDLARFNISGTGRKACFFILKRARCPFHNCMKFLWNGHLICLSTWQ
ncbi:hypothetical protein, partial [Microcoleus sp. CAWBG58]|uniref:hypothetical protein n=1 Tax=Microcoleus sp. CAWBG58 TaxID=2841651 RepID=UPI0025DBC66D